MVNIFPAWCNSLPCEVRFWDSGNRVIQKENQVFHFP